MIPEALAVIQQRQRLPLKTSVSAVSDLPPATEPKSPDETGDYGVAMWTGIDPEADRYTVFFTGFSNGFKKVAGPDGTEVVQMKTIQTKYLASGRSVRAERTRNPPRRATALDSPLTIASRYQAGLSELLWWAVPTFLILGKQMVGTATLRKAGRLESPRRIDEDAWPGRIVFDGWFS